MIVDEDIQKKTLGIMGFSIDRNGIFLSIGDAIPNLLGYHKDEMLGKNFRIFLNPEDDEGVWESFQKNLEGKLDPYVYRVMTKKGRSISIRTFSQPIIKNGKVIRIEGIMTEI